MAYLFDPEDPEYDPFSPFMQEEQEPPMPPPVDIPDENAETPTAAPQNVAFPQHILPFANLPSPALEAYQQHISTLPERDAYKASIGRRLLASLAGAATGFRNPGEGVEVANRIVDDPYREAVADWSTKGKALEAAAQQEGKTIGESATFNLGLVKNDTARAQLGARMDQIQKNYEIGMKNAKTAAERAAVLSAAQKDMQKFHTDLIGVRKTEAGSHAVEAEAAKTRAGAAVTAANASAERAKKAAQPKTLSSLDSIRVQRTAQNAVLAELPEAKKYIETDENGKVVGWKETPSTWYGGSKDWSPEEKIERAKVIKRYNELREEALKELNTRSITAEPGPAIPE